MSQTKICVLKLCTGEELIAEVIDNTRDGVKLKNPMIVRMMQTQQGFGIKLMPWIIVEPDATPEVTYDDIVTIIPATADTITAFMRETSSLELPPSTGGSILHS